MPSLCVSARGIVADQAVSAAKMRMIKTFKWPPEVGVAARRASLKLVDFLAVDLSNRVPHILLYLRK